MKEIWKNIKNYEGLYQISNFGNVKSLHKIPNIILKTYKDKKGYLYVILSKNCKSKIARIHRLVAQTFISNPQNKPQVNHIDGIKSNNIVPNLEWCTNSENQKHAFKLGLQNNHGNNNSRCVKINQYDLQHKFIKQWNSIFDITNELHIDRSCIWKCCTKKTNTSHGYIWEYADN